MKKRLKIVLFCLGLFGIVSLGSAVLGADYMCQRFYIHWPDNHQRVDGPFCQCDGHYAIGRSYDCIVDYNSGECTTANCDAVACCDVYDPNP